MGNTAVEAQESEHWVLLYDTGNGMMVVSSFEGLVRARNLDTPVTNTSPNEEISTWKKTRSKLRDLLVNRTWACQLPNPQTIERLLPPPRLGTQNMRSGSTRQNPRWMLFRASELSSLPH